MKTILIVVDNIFPGDVRVDKELNDLDQYFKVIVLCRQKGKGNNSNVEVIEVPLIRFKIIRAISDTFNAIFWIHLPLFVALIRIKLTRKVDLVHVHDLPLFQTVCLLLKNKLKVLDLHENYPEALRSWFERRRNIIIRIKNNLLFTFNRWKLYEQRMVLKADFIIAVVDEMANKLITENAVEKKITIINNFEFKSFVKFNCAQAYERFLPEIETSLLYVGNYGPHRGLDDVIKSLKHLNLSNQNLKFVIAGVPNNNDTYLWLNALISELGLGMRVKFIGKIPFHCYNFLLSNAFINIIPHKSNGHTENTIPHKLFQAFLARRPLIVSSCAPLKRFVLRFECGAVFQANNPLHLATVIDDVCLNYAHYLSQSDNAFHACYYGPYNWDQEAHKLPALYRQLLQS
jgi:glycosyltransferase involved in cell wall biosynthesis